MPPTLKFITPMWHPNGQYKPPLLTPFSQFIDLWLPVYNDGNLCISILHPPGEDQYGYESAVERWLPIHNVESIMSWLLSYFFSPLCCTQLVINIFSLTIKLVSVISLLSAYPPPTNSPANINAAKEVRENLPGFVTDAVLNPHDPAPSGCFGDSW